MYASEYPFVLHPEEMTPMSEEQALTNMEAAVRKNGIIYTSGLSVIIEAMQELLDKHNTLCVMHKEDADHLEGMNVTCPEGCLLLQVIFLSSSRHKANYNVGVYNGVAIMDTTFRLAKNTHKKRDLIKAMKILNGMRFVANSFFSYDLDKRELVQLK